MNKLFRSQVRTESMPATRKNQIGYRPMESSEVDVEGESLTATKDVQEPTASAVADPKNGGPGNRASRLLRALTPTLAVVPTTVLSTLLLVAHYDGWTAPRGFFDFVAANRASAQLIVQVLAALLGFLNFMVIRKLLHYFTRARLSVSSISLDTLRFWNVLLSQQLTTRLPYRLIWPAVLFIGLGVVPSALWAGALAPITTFAQEESSIELSSYANTTLLLKDWGSRQGLSQNKSRKGLFTYNVGERFQGSLLEAASAATTVDGSPGLRSKLDFSGYSFVGRSYGVGASVGLTDDQISSNALAQTYWFLETGYDPVVTCIYNLTTMYYIDPARLSPSMYAAEGYLPNSEYPDAMEYARYVGDSTSSIVAIGVASTLTAPRRIMGIAAGQDYAYLNATQCETQFVPTVFNVTVQLAGRNITVTPLANVTAQDMEPSRNLTFLANWQFTLIATDQTGLYTSLVGTSFNSSIENYITQQRELFGLTPSEANATLAGLQNSVAAMIDGILTGYAGAQLMVANVTSETPAYVSVQALRIGQASYIIAVAVVNGVIVILVILEAIRTRAWAGVDEFDFMDPVDLVLAMGRTHQGDKWVHLEEGAGDGPSAAKYRKYRIAQQGGALILSRSSRGEYIELTE